MATRRPAGREVAGWRPSCALLGAAPAMIGRMHIPRFSLWRLLAGVTLVAIGMGMTSAAWKYDADRVIVVGIEIIWAGICLPFLGAAVD
jgi:hypothetical protein